MYEQPVTANSQLAEHSAVQNPQQPVSRLMYRYMYVDVFSVANLQKIRNTIPESLSRLAHTNQACQVSNTEGYQ